MSYNPAYISGSRWPPKHKPKWIIRHSLRPASSCPFLRVSRGAASRPAQHAPRPGLLPVLLAQMLHRSAPPYPAALPLFPHVKTSPSPPLSFAVFFP